MSCVKPPLVIPAHTEPVLSISISRGLYTAEVAVDGEGAVQAVAEEVAR